MAFVGSEVVDGVGVVTLRDAKRRNALSIAMVDELVDTLDRFEARDDVGALIVTGEPPAFCAGAELGDLGDSRRERLRYIYEGFLRVGRCTLPTVAAVNGAAVGAGMNLALVCDVRIAARSARFDTRFLDLGIHPGGGHTWMLSRAVGPQAAAAMVLLGEVVDGPEAERIGLVFRCVEDTELLEVCMRSAVRAASVPRELLQRTKTTLAEVATIDDHDRAVDRELEDQLWSMDQPAFIERLSRLRRKISGPTRSTP